MRYSYKKALVLLTEWANKEGYNDITLDHDGISFIDWERSTLNSPKKIKIEGKYNNEIKTYIFLHELGHHQLRKDWDKFKKKLPVAGHAEERHYDGRYKRRVAYTVSCMEEEFKAWEEGLKLGIRMGIKVKMENWNGLKSKCLMSYMRYYSKK